MEKRGKMSVNKKATALRSKAGKSSATVRRADYRKPEAKAGTSPDSPAKPEPAPKPEPASGARQ